MSESLAIKHAVSMRAGDINDDRKLRLTVPSKGSLILCLVYQDDVKEVVHDMKKTSVRQDHLVLKAFVFLSDDWDLSIPTHLSKFVRDAENGSIELFCLSGIRRVVQRVKIHAAETFVILFVCDGKKLDWEAAQSLAASENQVKINIPM